MRGLKKLNRGETVLKGNHYTDKNPKRITDPIICKI